MAKKKVDDVDPVQKAFADGEQYQRDVNAKFEELGGMGPAWDAWCVENTAWLKAVSS